MTLYYKLPQPVDVVRLPYHEWADNPGAFEEVPDWLSEAWDDGRVKPVFKGEDYWYYEITTREGVVTADPDYYLARGPEGELWPIAASIFDKTYARWEEPTP